MTADVQLVDSQSSGGPLAKHILAPIILADIKSSSLRSVLPGNCTADLAAKTIA